MIERLFVVTLLSFEQRPTFIVLTIGMTIGFVMTSPDIPVARMVFALIGIALLMPILIYPFTFTIWLAIDLAVHRPDAAELAEAAAAVAGEQVSGNA